MKRKFGLFLTAVFLATGILVQDALADQVWISDILANPSRYWNMRVTVEGQVQSTTANPPGTTRGTYTLLDESGPNPLVIRTEDLPPLGKVFSVTGMITQDPANANVPIMREMKRQAPGMPMEMKILLIAGGALFLILFIIFLVLLMRPRTKVVTQPPTRPGAPTPSTPTPPPSPDLDKTTKLGDVLEAPAAMPDKTQVFISLGADLVVEKGPDKGKEFTLHKQVTTIGRPGIRKNDIEMTDDTVSKEQASILYDNTNKQFSISNESTTNPTKINGHVIAEPVILNNDDLVEMGKSILKFIKK